MELRRALQENCIVREPLLNARYEQQEVRCHREMSHLFMLSLSGTLHTPSANVV